MVIYFAKKVITMEQKILELRQNGMGYKKIAKQLGLTLIQVSDILFKHGITDHMIMPCQDKVNNILQLYNDGKGLKFIAKETNISQNTIRNVLKLHNIQIAEPGYHRNYKQKIDHNYFEVINSEHKAYWFGFLMADGYNNEQNCNVEITLKISDKNHLQLLQQELGMINCDIKEKLITLNGIIHKAARMFLYSKKLSHDLAVKGCVQRKSLISQFPSVEILPLDLQRHFIRGYYDGNGSLYINSPSKSAGLSIDSNEIFCNQLANVISDNVRGLTNVFKYYQDNQAGRIIMSGRINACRILNWFYDQSTVCLARKYNRFVEIINLPFHDRNISGDKPCELLENLRCKYQTI